MLRYTIRAIRHIPYGISNFARLISEEYVYIDRTDRIALLEASGPQLVFLRPRRFGKSLLLSMLANYYDVARADRFKTLFGHLAIGHTPTPLHNRYLVMQWDFSVIRSHVAAERIEQDLHEHINVQITNFARKYQPILQDDPILHDNALASFAALLGLVQRSPYELYLLIDEYDNFANEILMSTHPEPKRYEELLYGEGAFKTIFKAIKSGSTGQGLARVFITGVSPIVLSDVSSGYNIAEHIDLQPAFHDVCGFREDEITGILTQMVSEGELAPDKIDEAWTMLRTFYNGYRFSLDDDESIYNPTLTFYFLKELQRSGRYPRNMLDGNVAMDRAKLAFIARQPSGEQLILDSIQAADTVSVVQLADRFGAAEMLTRPQDPTALASLLYYLGALTLDAETPLGEIRLKIPNLVVRRRYIEQIQSMLLPDDQEQTAGLQVAKQLYATGDMQALCDFIEGRYFKVFDNRDYRWAGEFTLKTLFLTLLFQDTFYRIDSETALARGYADLTLIVRPEMRHYQLLDIVLEFKYVSLAEAGLDGETARYLSRDALRALPTIQDKLAEASTQLRRYHDALTALYGDALRLRAYAVVALGFERLAWEAVAAG